jgi:hypothetical protein
LLLWIGVFCQIMVPIINFILSIRRINSVLRVSSRKGTRIAYPLARSPTT